MNDKCYGSMLANHVEATGRIADGLDACAEYIEEHGWTQHVMQTDDGKVCAIGAVRAVNGLYGRITWTRLGLAQVKALRHTIGVSVISTWNDHPATTQHDVTDMFRRAAKMVRNGELS